MKCDFNGRLLGVTAHRKIRLNLSFHKPFHLYYRNTAHTMITPSSLALALDWTQKSMCEGCSCCSFTGKITLNVQWNIQFIVWTSYLHSSRVQLHPLNGKSLNAFELFVCQSVCSIPDMRILMQKCTICCIWPIFSGHKPNGVHSAHSWCVSHLKSEE